MSQKPSSGGSSAGRPAARAAPALGQGTLGAIVLFGIAATWYFVQPLRAGMMHRFSDDGTYFFTQKWQVAAAVVTYLVVIFGLKSAIKERMEVPTWLFVTHNLLLCGFSLLVAMVCIYQVIVIFYDSGFTMDILFCDSEKKLAQGEQIGWFYLFYLSKVYEFLDTVIIVVKKNPITFLHVYHHCITLVLTWVMLKDEVGVQYISIIMNLMVHVVMYFYYSLTALGHTVWWKKYITMCQITQFVVDIVGNSLALVYYYVRVNNGSTPCSGSFASWWFGQAVLASFLVLFIHLYVTKIAPGARGAQKKAQ